MTKLFFGKNNDRWNWEDFQSTRGFPIPDELLEWVIGQDKALEECKLCMDEWIRKLLALEEKKWWKDFEPMEKFKSFIIGLGKRKHEIKIRSKLEFKEKPPPKEWLPAGPFLLLLGDPGTGKSLIGRALSTHLTNLYKKYKIELNDVICWKNPIIPSEPRISIHPSPKGKELVIKEKKKEARRGFLKRLGIKLIQGILISLGGLFTIVGLYNVAKPWIYNEPVFSAIGQFLGFARDFGLFTYLRFMLMANAQILMMGGSLLLSGFFILWIGRMMTGNVTGKGGIGGAEGTNAPKLIVDNSSGYAPFVDATGHGSAQMFGSIAWDPYQTGGLGTPEHQRISAGAVHRAHLGILYIDEIKNLVGAEAVTLLTVLEDGQLPIALRSRFHGGDTAAMAVSSEPVPCLNFLVAAGNLDSIPQIHHALMSRIAGYGKVIYMNNDMSNNVENRRKTVQFISQEIKRFNLLPFSREACIELIKESSRKSGRIDKLATKFRPLISIIKTASTLASNDINNEIIKAIEHYQKKGIDCNFEETIEACSDLMIVEPNDVKEAIEEHCKSIRLQVLERGVENNKAYQIIDPNAKPTKGQIYGMAVSNYETGEAVGIILPIKASVEKLSKKADGYFRVTGVKKEDGSWIQGSISKVTTIIQQRYKHKDELGIHIDFAQSIGIDGPSAGVAMVLALISLLEKKSIRQDTTVTGEINISIEKKIMVTPIGGVHEKIIAAEKSGFKRVLIPKRNYELNINPKDYKIKVIPCETLADYIKETLVKK